MTANTRIQWLHKKLTEMSYPNAARLAERFGISHRQAQRDVDYLRTELGAPIAYSSRNRGFFYETDYCLPVLYSNANDDSYAPDISERDSGELGADEAVIQMQIPYTATVEIPEKLSAIELNRYIISNEGRNRFLCEFHSVENFMAALFTSGAEVHILEPDWLRDRVIRSALRLMKANLEKNPEV